MRAVNAARFSKVMRDLARTQSRATTEAAKQIKKEIESKMNAGQDPYGRSWRKKADGTRSTLKRSGRGRASIVVAAMAGAGIRIMVGVIYMLYQQFGGKSHLRGHKRNPDFGRDKDRSQGRNRPPRRSFLPFERMPKQWFKIVEDAVLKASRRVLRG